MHRRCVGDDGDASPPSAWRKLGSASPMQRRCGANPGPIRSDPLLGRIPRPAAQGARGGR
eukprot:8240302-Pyramimonas_sp.AAC.1